MAFFTFDRRKIDPTIRPWGKNFLYAPNFYIEGEEHIDWVVGYSEGSGSQSKQPTYMEVIATGTSGEPQRSYVTDRKIDFKRINWLYVDWARVSGSSWAQSSFGISTEKVAVYNSFANGIAVIHQSSGHGSFPDTWSRRTEILDTNNFNGSYYIRFHTRRTSTLRVYGVWGVNIIF